jgi:hypothetical protein
VNSPAALSLICFRAIYQMQTIFFGLKESPPCKALLSKICTSVRVVILVGDDLFYQLCLGLWTGPLEA